MEIVLLTLSVFTLAFLIMSVGIIFRRKPISGSCGGIANLMGDCSICEKKTDCFDKPKT